MNRSYVKPKLAVILNTLNEKDRKLIECLDSIRKNQPDQLVIVDGGSTDGTVDICKRYTDDVVVTEPGVDHQIGKALELVKSDLIIVAETDHYYPENLFSKLVDELIKSEENILHLRLKMYQPKSFLQKGYDIQFQLADKGRRVPTVVSGPAIWYTAEFVNVRKMCLLEVPQDTNCTDTLRQDIIANTKLRVKYSNLLAFQNENITWTVFFKRHLRYGLGDYEYFHFNKNRFNLRRKLKSITHVGRKYWIILPFFCLRRKDWYIGLPYFILVGLVRYYGFVKAHLDVENRAKVSFKTFL